MITVILKKVFWNYILKLFMRIKKSCKCTICDYSCSGKSSLKRHIGRTHEKNKSINSSICDYTCLLKQQIKMHIESVHTKNIKPQFVTIVVIKKGYWKYILNLFMRTKSLICAQFATIVVLKKVLWKGILNLFMRKKKLYKCSICAYTCYQKHSLKRPIELVHEKKEVIQVFKLCLYLLS